MVESVDGRRVHGAHHLQNTIEVIELLKDLQDLDDARYDGHTLLHVLRFYDAPEKHEKPLETSTYVSDAALNETYFSNHSVRLVVWRIIRSRFGELISLSSLVQTLPTSSDG